MTVTLSIKNVPEDIAEQLRRQAAKSHRSLQGELLAILERSVQTEKALTLGELIAELKEVGIQTPDESAKFIREDRDAR